MLWLLACEGPASALPIGDTGDSAPGIPTDTAETGETGDVDACDRAAREIDLVGSTAGDEWCPQDEITLRGPVELAEGLALTIHAGTVVRGTADYSGNPGRLTVRGTIRAEGTADDPVVLTALDGGADVSTWEGLAVHGRAPGLRNPDGDPEDSSGTLRYVRVEYGGAVDAAVHLVNVGRGTTLEYVSSVDSGDDGFEFDGGTVEGRWLAAFGCDDDGFQLEDGFTGVVRDVLARKCKGSGATVRASDPDDEHENDEPATHATIANATFESDYGEGLYLDNGGAGEFLNVLIAEDANCGVRIDDRSADGGAGAISIHHGIIWDTEVAWCPTDDGFDISVFGSAVLAEDPLLDDWMPDASSPALDPDNADPAWAGHVGAFTDEDWTAGWAGG